MAKRFTATEKWDDPFFAELSMENKLIWLFLLDKCNHAGIWDVNKRLLEFSIGTKVDLAEILKTFGDRIGVLDSGKWVIWKFIQFQYGELNEVNRAHQSVISILKKEGAYKGLISPIQGAKDKDKDKDKDKIEEKESEKTGFEHLDKKYPIAHCAEIAKNDQTWVHNSGFSGKWPDEFLKYLNGTGETEKHIADFKKHFFNWKKKQPADVKPLKIVLK